MKKLVSASFLSLRVGDCDNLVHFILFNFTYSSLIYYSHIAAFPPSSPPSSSQFLPSPSDSLLFLQRVGLSGISTEKKAWQVTIRLGLSFYLICTEAETEQTPE